MFVLLKTWKDSVARGHSLTLSSQEERSVGCVTGSCSSYPTPDCGAERSAVQPKTEVCVPLPFPAPHRKSLRYTDMPCSQERVPNKTTN